MTDDIRNNANAAAPALGDPANAAAEPDGPAVEPEPEPADQTVGGSHGGGGDPPPKPASQFAEKAGYVVMILSGLAILFAFAMLWHHVSVIEDKIPVAAYALAVPDCGQGAVCDEQTWRIGLESDAQFLRTQRVLSMLSTRITLFIFGEIVALTMCVAGGVLILNRIESATGANGTLTGWQLSLNSTFPGLLLCGLGALIVWSTLYYATLPESQVTIYDYPVFVTDDNAGRNLAGVVSGMTPGVRLPKVQTVSAIPLPAQAKTIETLVPSGAISK